MRRTHTPSNSDHAQVQGEAVCEPPSVGVGVAGPASSPDESTVYRDAFQSSYDSGMRALAGREHSRLELRRKLFQKGHDADVIDAVLERLADDGSLSEERFVESFVRSRIGRGDGPIKIRLGLAERGVADRLAADALDESDNRWLERAEALVERRFSSDLAELDPDGDEVLRGSCDAQPGHDNDHDQQAIADQAQKLRQRVGRYLNGKGYPSGLIVQVLESLPLDGR